MRQAGQLPVGGQPHAVVDSNTPYTACSRHFNRSERPWKLLVVHAAHIPTSLSASIHSSNACVAVLVASGQGPPCSAHAGRACERPAREQQQAVCRLQAAQPGRLLRQVRSRQRLAAWTWHLPSQHDACLCRSCMCACVSYSRVCACVLVRACARGLSKQELAGGSGTSSCALHAQLNGKGAHTLDMYPALFATPGLIGQLCPLHPA